MEFPWHIQSIEAVRYQREQTRHYFLPVTESHWARRPSNEEINLIIDVSYISTREGLCHIPKDTNDTIVQAHKSEVGCRDPDVQEVDSELVSDIRGGATIIYKRSVRVWISSDSRLQSKDLGVTLSFKSLLGPSTRALQVFDFGRESSGLNEKTKMNLYSWEIVVYWP